MESVQDTLRNHERRLSRAEVKIDTLDAVKSGDRLNRYDRISFAVAIFAAIGFWLLGNTPMVITFLKGFE